MVHFKSSKKQILNNCTVEDKKGVSMFGNHPVGGVNLLVTHTVFIHCQQVFVFFSAESRPSHIV